MAVQQRIARVIGGEVDCDFLVTSYRVLRTIEGRLRLMNTTARDDLPDDPVELSKLASLVGYADRLYAVPAVTVSDPRNPGAGRLIAPIPETKPRSDFNEHRLFGDAEPQS